MRRLAVSIELRADRRAAGALDLRDCGHHRVRRLVDEETYPRAVPWYPEHSHVFMWRQLRSSFKLLLATCTYSFNKYLRVYRKEIRRRLTCDSLYPRTNLSHDMIGLDLMRQKSLDL